MRSIAKQCVNRGFEVLIGLASAVVALRLVRIAESLVPWALVEFGDAEVMRGRFAGGIILSADAPWFQHALQVMGETALSLAAIGVVAALAKRLPVWIALPSAFVAFWFAASLGAGLAVYGRLGRGSIQAFTNGVGLPLGETEFARWAFVALIGLSILAALRGAVVGARLYPVTAFLIPAAIVYLCLPEAQPDNRFLQRVGIDHVPLLLAVLATIVAWKWRAWNAPIPRAAAVPLIALGASAFFVPLTLSVGPAQARPDRWVEASSPHWKIKFERGGFSPDDRQNWLRGATRRGEKFRQRLGIESRGAPTATYVAKSLQAFQEIAQDRRYAGNFYANSESDTVILAARDNAPDNPLAEPLLLMRTAWGEPASDAVARAIARHAVGGFHGQDIGQYASRISCEERDYASEEVSSFPIER